MRLITTVFQNPRSREWLGLHFHVRGLHANFHATHKLLENGKGEGSKAQISEKAVTTDVVELTSGTPSMQR